MPKISVIMGVYNCEDTIVEAIQSIFNQTYKDWELVICDDASTDKTYEIIKSIQEKYPDKIKLLKNNKNLKLAASLNRCLEVANGDYIARMDGDDLSVNTRFEEQVNFLNEHKEYDLVGTQMISFDENGDIGVVKIVEKPDKFTLRWNTPFCHATIMARKYVYEKLNGYTVSTRIKRCEDVDLWFRFYKEEFKGFNLQIPLYKVRERADDYKRRTLSHSIDAACVCFNGYRLLNYPYRYYIYLLKPIISGLTPAWLMKKIHDKRNRR